MVFTPDLDLDLVQAMYRACLDRGKVTDIAQTYQTYFALPQLQKGHKGVGITGESSYGFQWKVRYRQTSNAENIGFYQTLNISRNDKVANGTLNWTIKWNHWSIDRHEMDMNRDEYKIFDLVDTERYDAWMGFADLLEQDFWGKPNSSSDTEVMHGIFSYIITNGYSTTVGQNGGNPTGFSSGVGLNSTTYSGYKNWNGQYTNATVDDLYEKMKTMHYKLTWKSPISSGTVTQERPDCEIFGNYDSTNGLVQILEARNENFGNELSPYKAKIADLNRDDSGTMTFRRIPICVVPILDNNSDATDPIIFVDWNSLYLVSLAEKVEESEPRYKDDQPNVMFSLIQSKNQVVATRRHTLGILAK